jgi:predicted dehydrogenase
MKFVVAGLGSIGRRHLRNLAALGERDVVLYRTHHSTMPEEDLAGYPVETDLKAALAGHPDGVVVSNPTSLHLDVAIPAAKAGSHILLEKPIAEDLSQAAEFEKAVASSGSRVLVGFQFRFHPTLTKARSLMADGAIGRPVSAVAHWGEYLPGWHPWEDHKSSYAARKDLGGGVVLTLCHPLDYLRWMFGELESLSAYTAASPAEIGTDVDALAEINLRYQSGLLGHVHLDYLQRPGSHTLEINGTEGSLRWDNASAELKLYRASTGSWESFAPPDGFERNWLFSEEMKSFLSLIRNETASPCTLEDGIAALKIVMDVKRSAEEGCLVHYV